MMSKHTIPHLLVEMDEGIKEIRQLLLTDADRQAHEQALLTVARQERLLDDLRNILTNHHLATAVRVHKALERIDKDKIPF